MRHVERRAVIVAADQLNGTYQFFRIWIVEQKGEVLNSLVSQPAAARLLPRQVLIENTNRMSGARKFRAAHCARGSAADDRYVRHLAFSDCVEVRRRVEVLPRSHIEVAMPVLLLAPPNGQSTDREDNHAKTSEEYSTEDSRRQCGPGVASDNIHACTLDQAEERKVGCQQRQKDLAVVQPN